MESLLQSLRRTRTVVLTRRRGTGKATLSTAQADRRIGRIDE
jgi:hypothetical protein